MKDQHEQADDTLRFLEKRYRDLFQDAPVMYVITRNEEGVPYIEDCNELFLRTMELALEEAVGRPLSDFYTPEARAELLDGGGYQQALRGEFITQERRLVTRSGTIVETLLSARPVTDPNGDVVGTRAMYLDITDRKQAEEALRRSEEKYRTLFEESQDAIFISTPEGRLLDINPAGVDLLGFESKEELLEVDIERDLYRDPVGRQRWERHLARHGFVKDFELKLKKKDGTKLTVLETTTAVQDESGEVVAYRGVLRDVTHQRELEEQLRRSQRLEAVGQLAGGVAHDFNNLLTAIIGYAELGLKTSGPGDPHRKSFEEILAAGGRAAALTRQLLAFARQQVLQPRVLDLNVVVSNVDKLLRRTIGEDVELLTDLDPALGRVKADPGQIEQILVNLAVNARDAMPEGGSLTIRSANVELEGERAHGKVSLKPGPYVVLAVGDTGHGMDSETRSRIFEPFFTTKGPGKGTGLGLSTVYGIVKQSGGYVWVDSEPGRGALFEIFLPRVEEVVEPAPQPPARSAGGSETILLVEDEEVVCKLATRILRDLGYRVLVALEPEEALRISARHEAAIDLLLTDLVLPGMSGLELAQQVTNSRPGTKVLSMSGYTNEAALRSDPLGSKMPFLGKPFSPGSLAAKVREVLDTG